MPPLNCRIPAPDYERHPAYSPLVVSWLSKERWRNTAVCAFLVLSEFIRIKWKRILLLPAQLYAQRWCTGCSLFNLGELKTNGFCTLRVPEDEISRLREHLKSNAEEVINKKCSNAKPIYSQCISHIVDSNSLNIIRRFLDEHGILHLTAGYLGSKSIVIEDAYFQQNTARDRLNQDIFLDLGIPDPAALNFHIDYSFRTVKIIVYLSFVNDETGAFGYVPGSHMWISGDLERANRFALAKWTHMGIEPAERRKIGAIPRVLRRKAQFGNDMVDNDDRTNWLLELERKIFSKDSNVIIFDSSGVHRGGIVKRGRREVLQVQLAGR